MCGKRDREGKYWWVMVVLVVLVVVLVVILVVWRVNIGGDVHSS